MAAKADARRRIPARLVYSAMAIAGYGSVVAGVALIFPPLALVLGGLGVGLLGMVGLGLEVRR